MGLAEAEAAGKWLKENNLLPDCVLCSPARRTRETLEAVMTAIGYVEKRLEDRIYEATLAPWRRWWTSVATWTGC